MKVNIKSRCVVNWGNVSRSVLKIKIRPLADSKQAIKRKSPVWTGIQTGRGGRLLALPRERQMDSYHGAFGGTLMALTIYPECVLPASWHINGPTASACPLAGAVSLAGAAPFTFHHTGRKLSTESDSAMFNPRIFGRWSDAPKLFWCIGDRAI
jgi:hypothetical protein